MAVGEGGSEEVDVGLDEVGVDEPELVCGDGLVDEADAPDTSARTTALVRRRISIIELGVLSMWRARPRSLAAVYL